MTFAVWFEGDPDPTIERIIWPVTKPTERPVPPEVPAQYQDDYREACLVLSDSPNASAALSRRCLQLILRDAFAVEEGSLYKEIEQVIKRPDIPSYISETLHQIRTIGNFAAHANKYQTTGEIVPVNQGEAEWCLKVVEDLFDFCFVAPAKARERERAISAKFNPNQ